MKIFVPSLNCDLTVSRRRHHETKTESGSGVETRIRAESPALLHLSLKIRRSWRRIYFLWETDKDVRKVDLKSEIIHTCRGYRSVVGADLQVSSAFHPRSAANYFSTRLSVSTHTCEPPASPASSVVSFISALSFPTMTAVSSEENSACVSSLY